MKALRQAYDIEDVTSSIAAIPEDMDDLAGSLARAIDAALEGENGVIWKQSDGFAASMNNDCLRYLGYRLRGFEQNIQHSAQLKRIFDNGHSFEDRVQKYFDSLGIIIDRELKLRNEDPPLTGYVDFLIDWDGPKPVELKTTNEMGFQYRQNYKKPSDSHYRQLQVYLEVGGWDSGFVLYENKNNQEIKIFHVVKNQEFIDKLFAKWHKIYDAHKQNILSIRPYKQTSKKCQQCDAYSYCWNDPIEGKKL